MMSQQNISLYKNKQVAVIGLSVEGIDTVKFLSAQGAKVTCLDRRSQAELGDNYTLLSTYSPSFVLGSGYLSKLASYDLIVRSPGMALRTPELIEAARRGQIITSQTKLFFAHCPSPIIGVTGTKGKGTTSSLIYTMIRQSGKKAWLGGNIGEPLLSKIDDISPDDLVVMELSSFQLEDLDRSPHVSVVLKITQEHLANFDPNATNFHESREAYVDAKRSIIAYQKESDTVIYTPDDATSREFGETSSAHKRAFSRCDEHADAFVRGDSVFIRDSGSEQILCSLSTIHLRGIHNLENIAAAALASRAAGVDIDSIRLGAEHFEGLEHRLETVKTVDGVVYINDSFSTVPETAIAALDSFTQPLILIVGGSDKGSDYTDLGKRIARSSVHVLIVIGAMTDKILSAVNDAGYSGDVVTGLCTMKDIVNVSREKARPGDVVLLSPACASFDMFKNYKVRGKEFKDEVEHIS
jgi:UDP-N-acetylmuramoylalanine--D-glutamate ligase